MDGGIRHAHRESAHHPDLIGCRAKLLEAPRVAPSRPTPPGRKRSKGNRALAGARGVFSLPSAPPSRAQHVPPAARPAFLRRICPPGPAAARLSGSRGGFPGPDAVRCSEFVETSGETRVAVRARASPPRQQPAVPRRTPAALPCSSTRFSGGSTDWSGCGAEYTGRMPSADPDSSKAPEKSELRSRPPRASRSAEAGRSPPRASRSANPPGANPPGTHPPATHPPRGRRANGPGRSAASGLG
jgi:hypothetical protein